MLDQSQLVRRLLAASVALEAVGAAAAAVALLIGLGTAEAVSQAAAVVMCVLAGLLAVGLGFCARGVARGSSWAGGPVVTWQLLQAAIAVPMLDTRLLPVGAALLVLCALVVIGVVRGGLRPADEAPPTRGGA